MRRRSYIRYPFRVRSSAGQQRYEIPHRCTEIAARSEGVSTAAAIGVGNRSAKPTKRRKKTVDRFGRRPFAGAATETRTTGRQNDSARHALSSFVFLRFFAPVPTGVFGRYMRAILSGTVYTRARRGRLSHGRRSRRKKQNRKRIKTKKKKKCKIATCGYGGDRTDWCAAHAEWSACIHADVRRRCGRGRKIACIAKPNTVGPTGMLIRLLRGSRGDVRRRGDPTRLPRHGASRGRFRPFRANRSKTTCVDRHREAGMRRPESVAEVGLDEQIPFTPATAPNRFLRTS